MRRQQFLRVSELADFMPPVMRTAADFQRHGAGGLLRQELFEIVRACTSCERPGSRLVGFRDGVRSTTADVLQGMKNAVSPARDRRHRSHSDDGGNTDLPLESSIRIRLAPSPRTDIAANPQ